MSRIALHTCKILPLAVAALLVSQARAEDAVLERLRSKTLFIDFQFSPTGALVGVHANGSALPSIIGGRLIHKSGIGDTDLQSLAGYPGLEILSLNWSYVTDAGIESLAGHKQLRFLGLAGTGISDKSLDAIAKLPAMEKLDVRDTDVTSEGCAAFRKLRPNCVLLQGTDESFYVGQQTGDRLHPNDTGLVLKGREVTDDTLARVENKAKCERLMLEDTRISSAGILRLMTAAPNLAVVSIDGQPITSELMAAFAASPKLVYLNLNRCKLPDGGLDALAKSQSIQYLSLDGTGIGDEAIDDIASIDTLVGLSIAFTKVGDAGLERLAKHRRLVFLDARLVDMTKTGLADLRSKLLGVEVVTLPSAYFKDKNE